MTAAIAGAIVLATAVGAYADYQSKSNKGDFTFKLKEKSAFDDIKEKGVLKVCTTGDYRPFTYLDPQTNDFTGIDIDMAKHLAGKLNV
ncbi:MAG: transporter substrate-binding domain-containing protein, partial [Corynebacteriales bacterium]|nr:transporter substrate-binding domain-containing protein [Mycobacteriales bacterium]